MIKKLKSKSKLLKGTLATLAIIFACGLVKNYASADNYAVVDVATQKAVTEMTAHVVETGDSADLNFGTFCKKCPFSAGIIVKKIKKIILINIRQVYRNKDEWSYNNVIIRKATVRIIVKLGGNK